MLEKDSLYEENSPEILPKNRLVLISALLPHLDHHLLIYFQHAMQEVHQMFQPEK
jgi:hypothetical protein